MHTHEACTRPVYPPIPMVHHERKALAPADTDDNRGHCVSQAWRLITPSGTDCLMERSRTLPLATYTRTSDIARQHEALASVQKPEEASKRMKPTEPSNATNNQSDEHTPMYTRDPYARRAGRQQRDRKKESQTGHYALQHADRRCLRCIPTLLPSYGSLNHRSVPCVSDTH